MRRILQIARTAWNLHMSRLSHPGTASLSHKSQHWKLHEAEFRRLHFCISILVPWSAPYAESAVGIFQDWNQLWAQLLLGRGTLRWRVDEGVMPLKCASLGNLGLLSKTSRLFKTEYDHEVLKSVPVPNHPSTLSTWYIKKCPSGR